MESASVAAGNVPTSGGAKEGDKGLKTGALGYLSNLVIGVASTAPGYSLAATLGFVVAVAGMGAARAGGDDRLLHPDAADRGGLQLHEQGRPGLRHQLHLGDPGDGAPPRLADRLGDRRRRHRRDGDPRLHRRQLHLPAVRPRRRGDQPARHQHRGGGVDRRDDLDLLPGHRALGPHPVLPAGGGDLRPGAVRDRRPVEGLRLGRRPGGIGPRRPRLVQPVQPPGRGNRADRRRAARGVHLLGLGQRRRRQRGVQGQRQRAGQGGGDEHRPAGADLRGRRDGRAGIRRTHLPDQQRRRRAERARHVRSSARRWTSC